MNAPLRRVGVVSFVLFAMLFGMLNYQQWWKADDYRNNLHNGRVQASEYGHPRGTISLANGDVLAQSRETTDSLKYLRVYPFKEEYAHVVGAKPVNMLATDVERLENSFLTGTAPEQFGDRLAAMFTGNQNLGGIVQLTLSKGAQDAAYQGLLSSGNKKGAVIALDPKTGKVLAHVSLPSYDPNLLVSHDTKAASDTNTALEGNEDKPLADRATHEILAPGSTMKVIVSAAALKNGIKPSDLVDAGSSYQPLSGSSFTIKNAASSICPQSQVTLKEALTVSCNTAFAKLCVDQLGADKVKEMAKSFGFGTEPKYVDDKDNVMAVSASQTGDMTDASGNIDKAALAQSCIGQKDVRMTPLQGALMAATIANDGKQMRPYVVDNRQDSGFSVVSRTKSTVLRDNVVSKDIAGDLRDMMVSVVESGTGTAAKVSGLQVGGKTGTAENGEDTKDHGWFVGFAMKNGQPLIAVAVLLESAGKGGSHEAASIAGQVMKAYSDERGNK